MGCLRLAFLLSILLLAACEGGGAGRSGDITERIPHVNAPLDTTHVIVTTADTTVAPSGTGKAIRDPSWKGATLGGYPPIDELTFARYSNPQLRISIAYPDSLLKPGEPVGEGRGIELASTAGDVKALIFGIEKSTHEDLESQYRSILENPETRTTYRARQQTWYVISGREGEEVFYEKSVLDGGVLRTFRIHYPATKKTYFDAVTAMMASSF